MIANPKISVVIPIFNEEKNIEILVERLLPVMTGIDGDYEILFTNDGSTDGSPELLERSHNEHPQIIRVINFEGNYGQHMAIMAGFEIARGEFVITLDGDLQNPPEEIPKILAALEQGFDVVGGYRTDRQDIAFRRYASKIMNALRAKITRIEMRDQGCMLRGYRRHIVNQIVTSGESSTFIPALAGFFASNPTEVEVAHDRRNDGESKYSLYDLIRLNFDLVTGFSLVPLQLITLAGLVVSFASFVLVAGLFVRRLIVGREPEGLFTEFGILYFLIGMAIAGIGVSGEYVGRIYMEVRKRPRFVVRNILQANDD